MSYLKSTTVVRGAGIEPYAAVPLTLESSAKEEKPPKTSLFSAARPCL